MLTRLFRQRRRIIVLVLATMVAGALKFGVGTVPLLCGIAGLVAACCVVMLVPNRRRWIESLGIGLVFACLWNPPAIAFWVFAMICAVGVHVLIHGQWSDRTPLRLALTSHRVSQVAASPAMVWATLVPGESHPDDHWTGTLTDFDHDPDDPLTTYLRYSAPDGLFEDVTVTFLDHSPLRQCRYVIERSEDHLAAAGIMLIDIVEPVANQCQITSHLTYAELPPRIALGRWLDDTFGDEWDSFAATISARRDWSIYGLHRARVVMA